ncbi:MAG: NTP transferase domain-containing protein [Candidatus Pacearchaeota archaeon]|nr:MAG: NTP transferase domain-containing protein [Candidatus Pacearchaeota archaeon]
MVRKVDAIILAGGSLGRERIYPKALIEIEGKSLIQRQIEWLRPFVRRIVIACTEREAEQIRQYHPGIDVVFAATPELPGTAGSLKHALNSTETDDVIVANVDDMTDIDLAGLIDFGTDTICVANPRLNFAKIETEGHNIITFREKPQLENVWVNCGVYFLSKAILEKLPAKGNIAKDFFPYVKIRAYKHYGTWHTVVGRHV